ncbi:MAG: hypothetical protein MUO26_15710 [Methanotrichaceae archaeon]|nr:hypothetical protein [Methanotrichaceae archaeon]
MVRFEAIDARIKEGMEKVAKPSPEEFPTGEVAAASLNSFSRLIQLKHPNIIIEGKLIVIQSTVLLLSVSELLKHIKNRYKTPGENIFPRVVDEFILEGKTNALRKLSDFDVAKASRELTLLRQVVNNPSQRIGVIFIKSIDPLELVTEFIEDGSHKSSDILGVLYPPLAVITQDGAEFKCETPSEIRTSDGRQMEDTILRTDNLAMTVSKVDDGVIDVTSGDLHTIQANLLTIAAIVFFVVGLLSFDVRRFLFFGIGIVISFALAYLRFWSQWSKTYFGIPQRAVVGNAPMNVKFYASLS